MYPKIEQQIEAFNTHDYSAERRKTLQGLIDFIQAAKDNNMPINLTFICTHNSRRSHLSQVWAQTMASYFGISNVYCYSGGTEATALFPMVAETLAETGFEIAVLSAAPNPVYAIKYGASKLPIICFSKKYDHVFNPKHHFAAVMSCGHADENCPFVPGAVQRIPFTFDDPKASDGTPLQKATYHERSLEIAAQLYYIFSKIN